MKTNISAFLIIVIQLLSLSINAQTDKLDVCSTEMNWRRLSESDPNTKQRRHSLEESISQELASASRTLEGPKYVIPVVVHVLYHLDSEDISDERIIDQIHQLNLDFAKLNANAPQESEPFGSVAADMNIEFKLAELDARGNPTTGIERKNVSIEEFDIEEKIKFSSEGGLDAWNPKQYLNVWVCDLVGGLAGFATFPSEFADYPLYDGVVVDYGYFGRNRLTTHEIGHWLNLRHIWGDEECGDDMVIDTPKHEQPNYDCPTYPHNVNGPCNVGEDGEMYMNFMDYADNECTTMFTKGQRDRAHITLKGVRKDILTSRGLILNVGKSDVSDVYPNPSNGKFRLTMPFNLNQDPEVRIYDLLGNTLDFDLKTNGQEKLLELEMTNYTPGVHIVSIRYSNKQITKKVFLK